MQGSLLDGRRGCCIVQPRPHSSSQVRDATRRAHNRCVRHRSGRCVRPLLAHGTAPVAGAQPYGSSQGPILTRIITEMVMSTTLHTPANATVRARSWGSALVGILSTCWVAYLTRRMERVAIMQLRAMSERELQDIGLTRSQIERVVRGELDRWPFTPPC